MGVNVEEFKELSPLEFFYRNRELAGFTNPGRALYSSIRELIENSLDACELSGIKPSIYLRISLEDELSKSEKVYQIYVRDNGSGVPRRELLNAFSKPFYGTKYVLRQSRGLFGLGGTLALLYGQITTNKPITVTSSIGGDEVYSYKFMINIKGGRPRILDKRIFKNRGKWRGTIVEFSLVGNYQRVSGKIIEYLRQTTIIAPYSEIEFLDPYGRFFIFKRAVDMVPKPPKKTMPHPKSVDLETVREMIRVAGLEMNLETFLKKYFHRVGERSAKKFLEKNGFKADLKLGELSEEELVKLVSCMRSYEGFLPPSAEILSPIGEEVFKMGIMKEFKPEFIEVVSRPPSSYSGHPFIVEAAIACGGGIKGKEGEILIYRFANKIPLLYDEGSDVTTKVVNEVNWNYYKRPENQPIAFFFHVCSTKIPFRSLGKEFIADIPELEEEIRLAVRHLLRKLTLYTVNKEKRKKFEKKIEAYRRYLRKIARFSAELAETNVEPDISKILNLIKEVK